MHRKLSLIFSKKFPPQGMKHRSRRSTAMPRVVKVPHALPFMGGQPVPRRGREGAGEASWGAIPGSSVGEWAAVGQGGEERTQWPRSGAGAALAKGRRSVNVGRGVMAVSEKGVPRRWGSEGGRQGPVGVALARGAKACGCDGTGREAPRFPSVPGGPRSACSP